MVQSAVSYTMTNELKYSASVLTIMEVCQVHNHIVVRFSQQFLHRQGNYLHVK
jgi:hypothetical protein